MPIAPLPYIPSKGYGSLPYCDAAHNPNLVRVYLDAQHDYLKTASTCSARWSSPARTA